jgi:mannose-6-phosphate isomerase
MEKVWGGRRLESLGKFLPRPDARYGESWEVADMPSTSASGAGGGAVRSVIADGPLAGRTLQQALADLADALLPRRLLTPAGDFPLLVKFLDAGENLSVQVHPSPAYAAANPGAHLKTECWYILDADPGAVVYIGLAEGATRDDLARLAHAGDPRLPQALRALPAVPGTMFNLPSGTVHALGAGVLVAEVQTPSDTTFRLFDWGRAGREMHTHQALACILDAPPPPPTRLAPGAASGELVRTPYFVVTELRAPGTTPVDGPCLLIGAAGAGSAGGQSVARGRCLVIPAAARSCTLNLNPGDAVLRVDFPDRTGT